jgi:predicted metal-dependent phosphoesterase TrpH
MLGAFRGDPHRLNADLHSHSVASDGMLSPEELAIRAAARGVQVWALTDHDEVAALNEASSAARDRGLHFVPGVEISVSFAAHTVHILGLNIDAGSAPLHAGLASIRASRTGRAMRMADELARAALPALQGQTADHIFLATRSLAGNRDLIARTHFARYLVSQGVCAQTHEVFTRFMVPGKPGYVPHQWARLSDAVQWIIGAGGQAVVAHPNRYRFTETERWAFYGAFKDLGGSAIEVVTASSSSDQVRHLIAVTREYGFLASRGSDFHSPTESRLDLGELPLLPDSVVPIWHDWH